MLIYEVIAWEDGGPWGHDSVIEAFRTKEKDVAFVKYGEFRKRHPGRALTISRFEKENPSDGETYCESDSGELWFEFGNGLAKKSNCSCYDITYGKPRCMGTKERDLCDCGGDTKKCDFYEHVRNPQDNNKEFKTMDIWTLYNQKKVYKEDSLTRVLTEVMRIAKESGCVPEVSYNSDERATEFRFEGQYCDFSLFMK